MSVHFGGKGPLHLCRAGSFYPGAQVALDFGTGRYRVGSGGGFTTDPAALPGWSFTRASIGTALNSAGQVLSFASGQPRISDLGLLVEEARTNLLLRSQEADNIAWTKTTATVTADQAIAPDGTLTGDTVTPTASTTGMIKQLVTTVGGTTYNFSLYIKQGTSVQSRLLFRDETTPLNVLQTAAITWSAGVPTIGSVTAGAWATPIQAANGWWRISGSAAVGAAATSASVQIFPDNLNGTGTLYVWGMQLEAGAFPTSYIPTTSATVTRAVDVASITGLTAQSAYTLAAWAQSIAGGANPRLFEYDDGTSSNRAALYAAAGATGSLVVSSGGVAQADISGGAVTLGASFAVAGRVEVNNFGVSRNGGAVVTDLAGTMPVAPTTLFLGNSAANQPLNGCLRRAILTGTMTDAQLQALSQ